MPSKTLECSHATGAHDEACDLVKGLEAELRKAHDLAGELRVDAELARFRVYLAQLEDDNAALALAVKELVRCLGHERCSVCGQLYSVDPSKGRRPGPLMGCCLADHIEAYAAIVGKKGPC